MRTHAPQLWATVDELIAQAPDVAALRHHRVDLLAARQFRTRGLDIDPRLRDAERLATVRSLSVPHLLSLIRAAVDQPLVLMKGAEAAASYPSPGCRPFGDLDILTPDADGAFLALLDAGFVETGVGGWAAHHTASLAWPGIPLKIELHRTPHFAPGLEIPPTDILLRLTRPSRTAVEGIDGFVPAAHAVLLAIHAWADAPLARLGQLIDVAAVLSEGERDTADELARSWGCERLWRTTVGAIDGLLYQRHPSIPQRTWARHLSTARPPRVLELYLGRIAGPVWALPGRRVPGGIATELRRTVRPYDWESWNEQLLRAAQALRHPLTPVSNLRT